MSAPRVLVACDSLTVRMGLLEALEEGGFAPVGCASGEEARALARQPPPEGEGGFALFVIDDRLADVAGARLASELCRDGGAALLLVGDRASDMPSDGFARLRRRELEGSAAPLVERARALLATPPAGLEPRGRVLVVDDSATFRNEMAELLRGAGYEVALASSGDEALVRLREAAVDCVCLDMVMPDPDGCETCRRIKAHPAWRVTPVLMLTASEETEAVLRGLQAGADDFMPKSGEPAVLVARLRAQIRRRRYEDENRRFRDELFRARLDARLSEAKAERDRAIAESRAALLSDLAAKNAELVRAKEAAETAVQVRDDFLRIASHELKTPLTSLQLQLQSLRAALRRGLAVDVPQILGKVDLSVKQGERLTVLVENLLDVSRIESGHLELTPEPVDLLELARDVVTRFHEDARRANAELRASGVSVCGRWDRMRCEQVLTNLVANALKYGRGQPVTVEIGEELGHAILTVRDHGIGIAEGELDRIFGRFERAVSPRHYGGLGLGLYITRKIVAAHGGTISVESRLGEGSRFRVELPLKPPGS